MRRDDDGVAGRKQGPLPSKVTHVVDVGVQVQTVAPLLEARSQLGLPALSREEYSSGWLVLGSQGSPASGMSTLWLEFVCLREEGFPWWFRVKSACNAGDLGLIAELGRSPGGGHGNRLQYSHLENPHGQRSLEGCSPWGCKESDTTE